jgi:hypothetical protein
LGSFVATSGQKPWPSTGCFVAAYGQFFMAADRPMLRKFLMQYPVDHRKRWYVNALMCEGSGRTVGRFALIEELAVQLQRTAHR